jgi:hypothetical protein
MFSLAYTTDPFGDEWGRADRHPFGGGEPTAHWRQEPSERKHQTSSKFTWNSLPSKTTLTHGLRITQHKQNLQLVWWQWPASTTTVVWALSRWALSIISLATYLSWNCSGGLFQWIYWRGNDAAITDYSEHKGNPTDNVRLSIWTIDWVESPSHYQFIYFLYYLTYT